MRPCSLARAQGPMAASHLCCCLDPGVPHAVQKRKPQHERAIQGRPKRAAGMHFPASSVRDMAGRRLPRQSSTKRPMSLIPPPLSSDGGECRGRRRARTRVERSLSWVRRLSGARARFLPSHPWISHLRQLLRRHRLLGRRPWVRPSSLDHGAVDGMSS